MKYILKYKKIIAVSFLLLLLIIFNFLIKLPGEIEDNISNNEYSSIDTQTEEYFYVDVKGYVKKPGVYKVKKGTIVNELLKMAGGIKKNADTDNINLSKQVYSEMVVYVEKKKDSTLAISKNDCEYDSVSSAISSKININSASFEELMMLSGVGSSKAKQIIEYRSTKKFESIEDILNVSGFGESLFQKIKNNITV
mgnify:CR=1 FL=1